MTSTRPTNNIPEVKGKKSRTYEFVEQNPLLKRCADPIYDPIRDPTHPVHEECDIPLPGIEDAHARRERARLRNERKTSIWLQME